MIGRYQPWHPGHRALFEKALQYYGQVCICVRVMPQGLDNPLNPAQVYARIQEDLKEYRGRYELQIVPNTAAVVYGRKVGYVIEEISLPEEIERISATQIRAGGLE